MAVKRNLKALRELRKIFVSVPADKVHMRSMEGVANCGTVHCMLGWGVDQSKYIANEWEYGGARGRLGLSLITFNRLFAFGLPMNDYVQLCRNPHAISKEQALAQLDRVIAGKPIKPYVVKSP